MFHILNYSHAVYKWLHKLSLHNPFFIIEVFDGKEIVSYEVAPKFLPPKTPLFIWP